MRNLHIIIINHTYIDNRMYRVLSTSNQLIFYAYQHENTVIKNIPTELLSGYSIIGFVHIYTVAIITQ